MEQFASSMPLYNFLPYTNLHLLAYGLIWPWYSCRAFDELFEDLGNNVADTMALDFYDIAEALKLFLCPGV